MKTKLRKSLSLLLAVVMLLCAVPLCAPTASAKTSGNYTYTVKNKQATITKCKDTAKGNITVPSKLGGYSVAAIGERAFYNCKKLTGVTVPDSVKTIGEEAFSGCSGLKSIKLPKDLKKIEYATFINSGLRSISFPASVRNIDASAFAQCFFLKKVIIPGNVKNIGFQAFDLCRNLKSLTIQSGVRSIANEAFAWCDMLSKITLADGITQIGSGAFYNTEYYRKTSNWKNGVLYIGNYLIASGGGKIPSKIVVRKGTWTIADQAFLSVSSLKSVTIPDTVRSIGRRAFADCSGLTAIEFPKNVNRIGIGAFSMCKNLKSLSVASGNKTYFSKGNCIINSKTKELVAGCKNSVIPSDKGITSIADLAFEGCLGLKSVKIPKSVTKIGAYAFCNCKKLSSVTLTSGLKSIGEYAFAGCAGLKSITVPKGISRISEGTFYRCSSLKNVVISGSVTVIGASAFENCSALKSVKLPSKLKTVKVNAFYNTGLMSVTIPVSVKSIGRHSFGFNVYSEPKSDPSFTIKGSANSVAQKYAEKNHITFIAI